MCEECQRRKKIIEEKLRVAFENIRVTSNINDEYTAEEKHYVMRLISQFRQAQEEQDSLIEREKLRFQIMKNELGKNDLNLRNMRKRLKYFISLNKDHARIIEKIREDNRGTQKFRNSELRQR